MKRFFKEYFSFTKTERNGILVLFSIILILIVFNQFSYLFKNTEAIDFSEFEKEIDEFEASLKEIKQEEQYAYSSKFEEDINFDTINFFYFDPNKIAEQEWLKLGLSDKLTKTILNYTSKGGKFYENEDLKKIYGMSEKLYDTLKYYIQIKEQRPNYYNNYKSSNDYSSYENKSESKKENLILELNFADKESLQMISGIGESYSKGIVKYRDLLGGYYRIEQLNEVYGMRPESYEKIKDHFTIDISLITKINLNKAEFRDLARHPYIDKNIANALLKYRDKANIVYKIDELLENNIVDKDVYDKISPYLSTE